MILPAIAMLAVVPAAVVGQTVALWGQCGGSGYTGATTCASGSTCVAQNVWYSQCVSGTASASTTTLRTSTTTTSTATSSASSSSSSTASGSTKYIFSFGDSYSQTGFDVTGTAPSASNPLGNPTFPGSTSSGGTNWLGYLVTDFKPATAALLNYNFAAGGAPTNNTIVASWGTPLTTQVATFLQYVGAAGASAVPWTSDNAVFAVWIGINDIGNSYYLDVDQAALHAQLMDTIFTLVQQLYAAGARKFLFMSVPPVEKVPRQLTNDAADRANEAAQIADFNGQLVARAAAWQAGMPAGTTAVWPFDTQVPFNQVIADPAAYGYADATSVCQASTCMWWDNYHPSAALHRVVAEQVAEVLDDGGFW
ncbi:hypothetical protein DFP73DRAFT_542567 [Morchella snyderi]|nr:hypothetical protein DFP73DRAFT_542567 [Morchella snyderi]